MHIRTDDLAELMDCISITMSNSLLFVKLLILWFHKGTFWKILNIMSEDSFERASHPVICDDIMNENIGFMRRITKICFYGYSIGAVLFIFPVIFAPVRILVLKMELPFDPMVSPVYEIVCTTQLIEETAFAVTSGMLNCVIMTVIVHAGGQIDVMCREMEALAEDADKNGTCLEELKSMIMKHERIILFAGYIEKFFTYIALLQFLSNTLSICFSGFVIMTSVGTDSSAILSKTIPYYLNVNIEAFILCYIGEYLSSKSINIGVAAYNFAWYNLNPSESRYLLLLIIRAQRRLTITAGKFLDLSLESFASLLKASASYVSVLHAMY
ncbi:hypothetical protein KPH14_003026 [Odynerus spinipes]|uniref:Odorant receptor n=1 Tax=Odynerus spinipes TaxID=1348599 RepID=A0AAD9RWN1_9HYME|nr:hypothetical protein KPH14_003026 [Odynerus spinipes]